MPRPVIHLWMNNKWHKVISQYSLPIYLVQEYLESDARWDINGTVLEAPWSKYCPVCQRDIADAHSMRDLPPKFTLCKDIQINSKIGYALRICVDCKYWLMVNESGYNNEFIPKTIRKFLQTGWRPSNVDFYLSN